MKKFLIRTLLRFLPCAFSATNMNRIHAGTVSVFAYKSTDALATIVASGYFNTYTNFLRQGDQILISAAIGGTVVRDSAVVSSVDNAATVTVAVKA